MKFTKMQACGNDYIYVNCFEETVSDPAGLAIKLSDRNYGIGSDGLILIEPSDRGDAFMHMFNRDGSEGKMCGNGVRCVAKFIYDNRIIPASRRHAVIDTRSGLKKVDLEVSDGKVLAVTVDMGTACETGRGRIRGGDTADICYIGMNIGNPHAVIFIEDNNIPADSFDSMDIKPVGTLLQESRVFPDGVNVEFIETVSRNEIKMRVWERGSGETLACGTGAAASAAAGCITGKLDDKVLVHLAGGDITIHYDMNTGRCLMTGRAVSVFEGTIDIRNL